MKKLLTLLLAGALALSMFACGDKKETSKDDDDKSEKTESVSDATSADSSADDSSATSTPDDDSSVAPEVSEDSSVPADESSDVTSEPDVSEPDVSEPDEPVVEPDEPSFTPTGKVISKGCAYVAQDLFRQDDTWQWNPDWDPAYPDTNGTEMTDGVFASSEAHNLWSGDVAAPWAGFHTMHPEYEKDGFSWIMVDLGSAQNISEAKIYSAGTVVDNAIIEEVGVLVSADGENWVEFGEATVNNSGSATVVETSISGAANAQYVMFAFTSTGYWMAICEVEVLG